MCENQRIFRPKIGECFAKDDGRNMLALIQFMRRPSKDFFGFLITESA